MATGSGHAQVSLQKAPLPPASEIELVLEKMHAGGWRALQNGEYEKAFLLSNRAAALSPQDSMAQELLILSSALLNRKDDVQYWWKSMEFAIESARVRNQSDYEEGQWHTVALKALADGMAGKSSEELLKLVKQEALLRAPGVKVPDTLAGINSRNAEGSLSLAALVLGHKYQIRGLIELSLELNPRQSFAWYQMALLSEEHNKAAVRRYLVEARKYSEASLTVAIDRWLKSLG